MGVFIQISLLADAFETALGGWIVSACPVDIFALEDGGLVVRAEMEDECTLCELCLNLAPAGALTIHKLYKPESLVSRGLRDGDGDGAQANGGLSANGSHTAASSSSR